MLRTVTLSFLLLILLCHHVHSQGTLSPLMPNQTIYVIPSNASQLSNRTAIMVIATLLMNTNSTITMITTQQTTMHNNVSTKSTPYITLISCLFIFYTIIFEKYSRR